MQQTSTSSKVILGIAGTCFLINAALVIANVFAAPSAPSVTLDYGRLATNGLLGLVYIGMAAGCFVEKRQLIGVCAILLAVFSLVGMSMNAMTLSTLVSDNAPNEIFRYFTINNVADRFGLIATVFVAISSFVSGFARSRISLGIGVAALALTFVLHLYAYLILTSSGFGVANPLSVFSTLANTLAPALVLVGLHMLSKRAGEQKTVEPSTAN